MVTNILDYMYEGYGYDMDNQLLYTDIEKYEEALTEETKMSTIGMETLTHQGIVGHEPRIPTENDNKYNELYSFISERGAIYTDLRQGVCACNANGSPSSSTTESDSDEESGN